MKISSFRNKRVSRQNETLKELIYWSVSSVCNASMTHAEEKTPRYKNSIIKLNRTRVVFD